MFNKFFFIIKFKKLYFMQTFIKTVFSLSLFLLTHNFLFSQVTVPISEKEMEQYNRERQAIMAMKIDLSQTWLYMVKNNVISSNKILLSEVFYSKQGLPELVVQYDENQKITSSTRVKYNSKNLPFEEIKFAADSSLIGGILFEYDKNGLLNKQVHYNESGVITAIQQYLRKQDTIFMSVFNNSAEFIYGNALIFENKNGQSLLKSMYKIDSSHNIIEKNLFDYDEIYALRSKIVYDDKDLGTQKNFVYNDDGALVRTIITNSAGIHISDTSFEYDEYGNLIRIVEYEEETGTAKLFFINYLSLVKGKNGNKN